MNSAFATGRIKGTVQLDPVVDFKKGLELLRNEYPQRAMGLLQRAFESDKHTRQKNSGKRYGACR